MLKKQQRVRPVVLTVCLAGLAAAAMAGGGHEINHSPLDHVVIFESSFDKTRPVRMQRFAAEDADVGKSGKGEVRTAAGQRLAEFQHCRVGFMGLTGGEASKQMTNDAYETGSHLAVFLAHWADGDYAH